VKQQSVLLFHGVAFGKKHASAILMTPQFIVFTIIYIFYWGFVSS